MKSGSFAERVYRAARKIPRGKVTTYKEIALKLNTKAYRAVGTALNKNPYSAWGRVGGKCGSRMHCIVPCHRVVNSNGNIGGFARGLRAKAGMLRKEGVYVKKGKIVNFEKVFFRL